MSNYRVSRALNNAMKSGSMVVMTPAQVQELMGSSGGSGATNYRGGRGRGRGFVPRGGRGRGYSPRDGRRDRTESFEGARSHYNNGNTRDGHYHHHYQQQQQHQQQAPVRQYESRGDRRFDPYANKAAAAQRSERDGGRGHQRSYSDRSDHRGGERNYHKDAIGDRRDHHQHHRSHSGRDERHERGGANDQRQRSPRQAAEPEKHVQREHVHVKKEEVRDIGRELPRDDYRPRGRGGRGRGIFRGGRGMGMVSKYDRFNRPDNRFRMVNLPAGRFMRGRGGMGNMRGRGFMPRRTFNAYYYCRMCERRYYGNRDMHKNSREHKEAVRKSVQAIESNRKEVVKDILEDFQVMDEVGGESDEEKEKREDDVKTSEKSEDNLEDGEIKDKKKAQGKTTESRAMLNQEIMPDISKDPLGLRYIISVSGYFCKLCSKFYHDEKTATNAHVKTPQHLERVLKAAKEQYTKNYLEKKRSEPKASESKSPETKPKAEPMETKPTGGEKTEEKKAKSEGTPTPEKKESIEKKSTMEADARKAGKAAASAKIAAVTAKFSAPKKATPRRSASTMTRKSITSLRARRTPKKPSENDVGNDVNDAMDDVSIEAPERGDVISGDVNKQAPEEGEITDGDERAEIDDTTLDSAAPTEIPGLDLGSMDE